MNKEIYLVTEEFCRDGEITFDVFPCVDEQTAQIVFNKCKLNLNADGHFKGVCGEVGNEEYDIKSTPNSHYFISDNRDDFYCDLWIKTSGLIAY